MGKKSMGYFKSLNKLFQETVDHLLGILRKYFNNGIEEVPSSIFNSKPRITEELTRLIIRTANGKRSWNGLVVCFPGTSNELATEFVGTPYLRRILYPMLEL